MAMLLILIFCFINQGDARSRDIRYDGDRVFRFPLATWNHIKNNNIVKDAGIIWREGKDEHDVV